MPPRPTSSRSRLEPGEQLAERAARGGHDVEALGIERNRLRRLDDGRAVPLRTERVDRSLAAVCERQLHAVDARPLETVCESGRRGARGENALEASRARERAQVSASGSSSVVVFLVAHLCLIGGRHHLQHRERQTLAREEQQPDADADRRLDRLQAEAVRNAVRVGDAVAAAQRRRDRDLREPDVAGPEREHRRDVHQQQHDAGGRQRRVDVERAHRRPHGEQLAHPAEDLEEDRERRSERASASRRGPAAPSSRCGAAPPMWSSFATCGRRALDEREREEQRRRRRRRRRGS